MEITLGEDFELSGAQWDGMLQNVHKCSDARKALRKAARVSQRVPLGRYLVLNRVYRQQTR